MASVLFQRMAEAIGRVCANNPKVFYCESDSIVANVDEAAQLIVFEIMEDLGYDDHMCERMAEYASQAVRAVQRDKETS